MRYLNYSFSIQLSENVKFALDQIKNKKETYEELIVRMISFLGKYKRSQCLFEEGRI